MKKSGLVSAGISLISFICIFAKFEIAEAQYGQQRPAPPAQPYGKPAQGGQQKPGARPPPPAQRPPPGGRYDQKQSQPMMNDKVPKWVIETNVMNFTKGLMGAEVSTSMFSDKISFGGGFIMGTTNGDVSQKISMFYGNALYHLSGTYKGGIYAGGYFGSSTISASKKSALVAGETLSVDGSGMGYGINAGYLYPWKSFMFRGGIKYVIAQPTQTVNKRNSQGTTEAIEIKTTAMDFEINIGYGF